MAKRKRGRPSLFTPQVQKKIISAVASGNFREIAARHAGVSVSTFRDWLARGKKEKAGEFHDFLDAVLTAQAKAEFEYVKTIWKARQKDAKQAQWWLERTAPERWSRDRLELKNLRLLVDRLTQRLESMERERADQKTAPQGQQTPATT